MGARYTNHMSKITPPFTVVSFFQLIVAIALCQSAGLIGAIFTADAIPNWYATLEKPFFNPPNWVFGPVWTLLYTMMGISLFLIWRLRKTDDRVTPALRPFFIQLALNTAWSILFFSSQQLWVAFAAILVLWWFIFSTIRQFLPISRTAGWLLVPYLAWVSFATVLNLAIAILN